MITDPRLAKILDRLQDIASGELDKRLEISTAHDEIDAIAYAVNVVAGELGYVTRRLASAKDEAERANAMKTEFLRNISHELRTPISVIHGVAQLLQSPASAGMRDELYRRIIANVRQQTELLDDLLDLSQVESGKLAIEMLPTSVGPLVDEVVASMEPAASHKGLVLTREESASLDVLADRRRLRQILLNVIGNAIKFTARGTITVRPARVATDVVIDIADTGLGIDPAAIGQLFQPFVQASPSIAREFGGTGLGLALARRLAREMSGSLVILATAPGVGTTVRLSLPALAPATATSSSPTAPAQTPLSLDGVRVLLVDDHRDTREPIVLLLESRGATVVEAAGGSEAIMLGVRDDIDLILMDIRMPEIDGLEATRRLRALGVAIPIVALTADVVADHKQAYVDAGCSTQLAKPIDIDRLVAVIHELRVAPQAGRLRHAPTGDR